MTARDLERRVVARAERCGIALADAAAHFVAEHARAVLASAPALHLTAIATLEEFLERHVGESFEGAAMLAPDAAGAMLDLGTGNGYPALPLWAARPGLAPVLVEASARRAAFLREVLAAGPAGATVHDAQVQRAPDLPGEVAFRVVTTRAMGGWERVLPRLEARLAPDAELLVWAGTSAEVVARRAAWQRRYRLADRRALPGRERSWVWRFVSAPDNRATQK